MSKPKATYTAGKDDANKILAELEEAYSQQDVLKISYLEARDAVIPEEVEAALADVDSEFSPKLDAIEQKITRLESMAKEVVAMCGESVKSNYLHAVYQKGRVSWDNKKLEGLMMVVPQLESARTIGAPSVSIRKVSKGS